MCRFRPDDKNLLVVANSIIFFLLGTLYSSRCPRRLTIAHDTESDADQHAAT